MNKEEKQKQINNAVEYYKNSTDELDSIKNVAKKFGIGQCTLSKYLKKNNIPIRPQAHPKVGKSNKIDTISDKLKSLKGNMSDSQFKKYLINLAIEEYINTSIYERSIQQLSDKYGLNRKTICKYLKERGVEITNVHNKVPFREDFFDTIDSEEKAYWLGFLYADGYISSNCYKIGLGISLKDSEHLQKFNNTLNYPKGMNVYESKGFGSKTDKDGNPLYIIRTVITNEHMWNALNSKGCVPNKSLVLKFPDESIFTSKDLIKHFIRGYVDGDGTLGVYPHSKTNPNLEASLLIVGTKSFLEGIQNYLGIKGFLMQKPNCNELTYRLGYSTSKAVEVATVLYENASIYLDRKYNIYTTKFADLKSRKNGKG